MGMTKTSCCKTENQSKGKKLRVCLVLLWACLLLEGCQTTELEERGFPLALGVDKSEEGMIVSFDFPDLSKVSEQKKSSPGPTGFSVEAGAYYEAQKAYENNSNHTLDYNHLKAIVIGQDFLKDGEAMQNLLSWLEGEDVMARNTCLFVAKDGAASILALTDKTEGSVGKYLEQMVESQTDFKANKQMNIGKLMNQWHDQNELLLLPVLTDEGGIPAITEYAVVDAFAYKGNISVEDSMKAFLTQGLLDRFTYRMEDGSVLEIQDIGTKVNIESKAETARIKVSVTGKAYMKKAGAQTAVSLGQRKKLLNHQLKKSLEETSNRLRQEMGMDIVDSYSMLGGYNRTLYGIYKDRYAEYGQSLQTEFSVVITVIND